MSGGLQILSVRSDFFLETRLSRGFHHFVSAATHRNRLQSTPLFVSLLPLNCPGVRILQGVVRLLVVLVISSPVYVSARMERYSIRRWTTEDGLPQSRVSAVAQTPDGYLWLGTWFGLARFDGV